MKRKHIKKTWNKKMKEIVVDSAINSAEERGINLISCNP
jgi:hypothetical protein